MATGTHLMTVEEFRSLAEDRGPSYHELRNGELVSVTRPKFKHSLIQGNLCEPLKRCAPEGSYVQIEVAFRPLPEYELWVADVAYLSRERFQQTDPEDNVQGAPDLVIEVLSPSNTVAEMYDREKTCLENGAQEFWVVDPDRRQVKVSTRDGKTVTRREGQEIPMASFGWAAGIKVHDILRY